MQQGAERNRLEARKRPTRAEIEPAALRLLQRHGAAIMATARRFAATPEDAEDAYQRGVEILLTKAPTTAEEELVPWLRTVVKHEAWALRRQRRRAAPVADDGEVPEPSTETGLTHDQAERIERLRLGAEAMKHLKPQEIRALLLKAEGYSYKQIQEITGWTYTKVNRCLTEGRKAFLERVAGIEAGSECERLAPLLSKLADGEATAEDLSLLRPHVRTCLSCRAALREFRSAPATAAALVPAAALAVSPSSEGPARLIEAMSGWLQKGHALVEMASAQKVAAIAASTAALAGGGTAAVREVVARPEPPPRAATVEPSRPARPRPPAPEPTAPPVTRATAPPAPSPAEVRAARRRLRQQREKERARAERRRTPPAQQEFDPAWAANSPAPARATATTTATPEPAPAPQAPRSGGGAEEFAP